jgi:tetratricopeptide (TPR) repeat protein
MRANWEKERVGFFPFFQIRIQIRFFPFCLKKGNLFLQNNQLDEAINCYTRAIDLNPNNAIYLANRALCLIKQEKYAVFDLLIIADFGYQFKSFS